MADKLEGSAIVANTVSGDRIVTGSITTTQLAPSVANFVNEGKPLKIQTITYPGNDTAANTGGGQTIILSGSGFKQNVQVYINSNAVPSVTYANANAISFTTPALTAATYPVYVINTDDGATAILIPGIQYSGTPTWTTTTPLTTQQADTAWSIQLIATSDSAVSYSLQAGSSLPAGITLAANGLISGTMTSPPTDETTYNFTVVANDLEQQDASRAFSVSVTVTVLDPFFTYTTLLLHGDGTNNANNHAFVDSSNNNFAITRNGNATQGTFSPFGDNWSVYLDGNGDYLRTNLNAVNILTAHTIEGWFYTTTSSVFTVFSGSTTAGVAGGAYYLNEYLGTMYLGDGVSNNLTFSASLIPLNQWFHIAITFDGTTYKVFINGNLVGSSTTLLNNNTLNGIDIGGRLSGVTQYTTGYISNFRVLKGTALYTSAFTPPTQPLAAVSNTSLLTCQSNAFVDKGPNRFAITRNGDTRVSKFDPFKPYKAIPASYGVYFDGASDYLDFPANTACAFGTGDFTVECWMRTSTTSADSFYRRVFMVDGPTGNAGGNFQITLTPSSGYILLWDSVLSLSGAINVCDGNWHHIAATRSGTTLRLFVDGVLDTSGTYSTSVSPNSGSPRPRIGSYDGSGGDFEGYISNLRVLKGTALYTTTFTPPTSQLTAIANTQLLTCQSTTLIDNSTNAFTITVNGNAGPTDLNPFTTTFVNEKYNTANGGGSLYCDGSGDYLSMTSGTSLGSGDFTIGCWVYLTAAPQAETPIGSSYNYYTSGQNGNFVFRVGTTNLWRSFDGQGNQASITGTYTWTLNTWMYMAWVRSGSTLTVYKDGVSIGSVTDSKTLSDSANGYAIGADRINGSIGTYLTGYLSGFRILVGTADSTVPTAPPTAIANTKLLCNFTNAGILDSVGKNVLETVGDARVNTSIKKYGTGSMYFDGTGDYIKVPSSDLLNFGTGDFTIEFWVRTSSFDINTYYRRMVCFGEDAANNLQLLFFNGSVASSALSLYSSSLLINGTIVVADGNWHHIALCRTGTAVQLFVDGTQSGATATSSQNFNAGASNGMFIGRYALDGGYLNGHLDDLRITKGVGRYRYNFTPPTKAFNDGDGSLANNTTDVLVGDQVNTPVFPYTTLLLHGDGTNNANNHAFVDSSNNNFAITRNGNATQGTFSPFSQTGWGNYFDGSGDYLTAPSGASPSGTGTFTVEFWIYPLPIASGYRVIFANGTGGGFAVLIQSAGTISYGRALVAVDGTTTGAVSFNQWNHVALVRSGTGSNQFVVYINGTSAGTFTNSTNYSAGTAYIGIDGNGIDFPVNAYLSNVRVTNTAVYTSNFTPSTTPLTAITNTSLLTCQSNRFIDNSTNNFAITRNGDVSVQAFSPFAPSVEYTANTHGGSAYFDGTGDYLSVGDQAAFEFGSGDYTIELWWYPTSSTDQNIIGKWDAGGSEWILQWRSAGYYRWASGGSIISDANFTLVLNAWNHVAVTKSGTSLRIYSNGVQIGTTATEGTISATGAALTIGASQINSSPLPVLGYISSVRILKGTAQSTGSTYTVPTSPATAITNTSLLCNFTNAGILDSTGKNVLETVGDAKVNTAIKKYGTGSMAFDGTGDYLLLPSTDLLAFGTGDYTIECWVYHTSVSGQQTYVGDTPGNTNGPYFYKDTNHKVGLYYSSQVLTGSTTIAVNTWYHVAVSRASGTVRLFVNGNQEASATDTTNLNIPIRYVGGDTFNVNLTGYIDDLRITKGIARYIYNFNPPTAAFLNK